MRKVEHLIDSSDLIDDPAALRERYLADGVVFLRNIIDPELIASGREKYLDALAAEGLIDGDTRSLVWTGRKTTTWRPCDVIGTAFWQKVTRQPLLNRVMRAVFNDEPVWIPIAAHRSGLPTGPVQPDQDIFAGRHQDGFYNEGMLFSICWMPVRDVDRDRGSFAVAPGTHHRGVLHDRSVPGNAIPRNAIPDDAWRSADFRVGDVLIFNYLTAHAGLPNPSDEIRLSLDVRAIPASAPQPVIGTVDEILARGDRPEISIRTAEGDLITVRLSERTLIRDMNPWPRIALPDFEKIAHPGAQVMAMTSPDGAVSVLRPNFY